IQAPWHYLWYSVVALLYGAVVIFFVGFLGSLGVYLAGWGVGQAPGSHYFNRQPTFLFVYAPTSFGWRTLLLEGATVGGQEVVEDGKINPKAYDRYLGRDKEYTGKDQMYWHNHTGAVLVAIWLGLFFLLVLGVGYSYFWSASTIIYLLMRKQVDDAELDEVYFEEDEQEDFAAAPPAAAKPAAPPADPGLTMVEPPAMRTPPTPAPPAPPPPPAPAPAAPKVEEKTSAAVATPPPPPPSHAP